MWGPLRAPWRTAVAVAACGVAALSYGHTLRAESGFTGRAGDKAPLPLPEVTGKTSNLHLNVAIACSPKKDPTKAMCDDFHLFMAARNDKTAAIDSLSAATPPRGAAASVLPPFCDCGEDAYFIAENSALSVQIIGVSDGVGGWSKRGVDPSLFSRTLMGNAKQLAVHADTHDSAMPKPLLAAAHMKLLHDGQVKLGSATACVVTFERSTNTLHGANLGDSGYRVVRGRDIIFKSPEQQHKFNTPYQLAALTEEVKGRFINDSAHSAQEYQLTLQPGDVVVVATDGVLDNIHDNELIEQLTAAGLAPDAGAQQGLVNTVDVPQASPAVVHNRTLSAAQALCKVAIKNSMDEQYDSPFAMSARKHGRSHVGGKEDDVTVIVATVESLS